MLKQFSFSNGYKVSRVFSDVGSGINFEKRKDFFTMLNEVMTGRVEKVVITYKDRLSRVGFELFIHLFRQFHCEIIVMSESGSKKLDSEEIFEEIVSLLHCYSMKLYSKRKAELRKYCWRMTQSMTVTRVEKHNIKLFDERYALLKSFCHLSKNLYNFANYYIRQAFFRVHDIMGYYDIEKLVKHKSSNADYYSLPTAQSAQQTLRVLSQNWASYESSIKDYKEHPDKYTGKPRIPNYLPKEGNFNLILTNQNCKLVDGEIHFPKTFGGLTLKTKISGGLQQLRIIPHHKRVVMEIVYRIEVPSKQPDNGRYMSIDIGLDNLAAITSNTGLAAEIINGKGLKSINKHYNKLNSYYQEIADRMKQSRTKKQDRLTNKRNNRINDYMHKASRYIINRAIHDNIRVIVIGNNKDWKRGSVLSKNVNQTFVGIPHQRLIEMIVYKAQNIGVSVILSEESYTSGTSFLDDELPIKENYNKSRRKHRGLFVSNTGKRINADVNASLQILKKVFPNVYSNGISGIGLCPFIVNVA
jgi:putative transposase